jgi:YVTN family beta-propeller protein
MKFLLRGSALAAFTFVIALKPVGAALPPDASDPVVNVNNNTIIKLNAADGTVLWSNALTNDGALAVDPGDFSVYTALGGHSPGTDGTVYKFNANGAPAWTNTITLNSFCDFEFVTNSAVDAASSNPGVIWSESGCFGALAKSDRVTGAQQWSVLTYDIGRPLVDPSNGQIYDITNAGNNYDAETIYSVSAGGSLSFAASCEGYTDLNPADGNLYRGGGNPGSRGCGTVLYQMNKSNLGTVNWALDLSSYINSFDSVAVQPWQGGLVYVGSVASSKIVIVDPATQSVVASFSTAVPPRFIAIDPAGGNVYVADDQHPFLIAYSWTGALVWINPNLGGPVSNLAVARGLVGTPPLPPPPPPTPTPSPTPSGTPTCGAPTVRIATDRNSIHKGENATITLSFGAGSAPPCQGVVVYFIIKTRAQQGVDYVITDSLGQVVTNNSGQITTGALTLHNLFTSRKKTLPVNIVLQKNRAYYLGNTQVTVQLLAN